MSDIADITADREELEAPARLKASRRPEGPQATGQCHYCGTLLGNLTDRFCDSECRDEYEAEQRQLRALGGRQ